MSTAALLGIAAGAIIVLLILVIRLKVPAFVGLILVAFGTALATGIQVGDVVGTMTEGMGNTLSSVMIIVGLGAMLGRIIEAAGGADILAIYFTNLLGRGRVIAGVTAAAFILGIPVFFDVGFIILAPIVFGFSRVAKINPLKLGFPVAATMLLVHVALPPHPGPVAAAGITQVDNGLLILVGLPICIVTAAIGFWAAKLIPTDTIQLSVSPADSSDDLGSGPVASSQVASAKKRRIPEGAAAPSPAKTANLANATKATSVSGPVASSGGGQLPQQQTQQPAQRDAPKQTGQHMQPQTHPLTQQKTRRQAQQQTQRALQQTRQQKRSKTRPLNATTVVLLIILPIAQIMCGTVGNMLMKAGTAQQIVGMIGSSVIALLCAVIVAHLVIGHRMAWDWGKRGSILDSALPDVAVIVFVTGAGGVFANVLVKSGIGDALSTTLMQWHLPIILAGFLISAMLRLSQGSATVAILTSAGLMAQPIADAGYSGLQIALVTLAIGLGGLGFSHINDSGFWIVTKYLGLSVKDGLRTWTVLTTIFGLVGFALTWGLFLVVS